MTPRELEIEAIGRRRQQLDQLKHGLYVAYHMGVFSRIKNPARVYRDTVARLDRGGGRQRQSTDEMIARAKAITEMLGGTIREGL